MDATMERCAAAEEQINEFIKNDGRYTLLGSKDITADYMAGLETAITAARGKMASTGQANSGQQPATLNAENAERALITILHAVQAAAKQKHQMLAEDDDVATNFSTAGYLIGERLNPNRQTFLQNAAAMHGKAAVDQLPGYKTADPNA